MRRTHIIFVIVFAFLFVCEAYADRISIPCYENLLFYAGEKTQSVEFHNPGSNSCFVRMTLMLTDGKVLWRSDLLAPGEKVDSITLSESLDEGTYSARLINECFALTDKSRLNGLNAEMKLIVRRNDVH